MTVTTPLDDPGARLIDRIITQILAERPPVACAAVRLLVAADLGDVLDRWEDA